MKKLGKLYRLGEWYGKVGQNSRVHRGLAGRRWLDRAEEAVGRS